MAQVILDVYNKQFLDLQEPAQFEDEELKALDLDNEPKLGLSDGDSETGDNFIHVGLNGEPATICQVYWRLLQYYNPDAMLGDEIYRRHND